MVVTIHDLLWHQQKGSQVTTLSGWQYWLKYLGYRLIVRQALTKAQQILVPAETIRQTITKSYPLAQDKITVTTEGVDQALVSRSKTPTKSLNKKLLYVGSLYPHKNITRVIDGLEQLPDHQLQIVGSRSIFQDKVKAYVSQKGLTDRVEFLGFVPDEQLLKLYQTSLALVQPSLSEGFGLTGLEAMAAGGRVIASDIPIFREIYGPAALLFDPHSTADFVQKVKDLGDYDPAKLNQLTKKVVAQYSWDTMAAKTLATYQTVLSS
jgi:glycosyltransferase involved in cell wall biosynthesis